jgi:hypothetical protein
MGTAPAKSSHLRGSVSESWRYRQAKLYRKKVRHIRNLWFVHHIDMERIAIKLNMDVGTVRGIISYRIAGAVE